MLPRIIVSDAEAAEWVVDNTAPGRSEPFTDDDLKRLTFKDLEHDSPLLPSGNRVDGIADDDMSHKMGGMLERKRIANVETSEVQPATIVAVGWWYSKDGAEAKSRIELQDHEAVKFDVDAIDVKSDTRQALSDTPASLRDDFDIDKVDVDDADAEFTEFYDVYSVDAPLDPGFEVPDDLKIDLCKPFETEAVPTPMATRFQVLLEQHTWGWRYVNTFDMSRVDPEFQEQTNYLLQLFAHKHIDTFGHQPFRVNGEQDVGADLKTTHKVLQALISGVALYCQAKARAMRRPSTPFEHMARMSLACKDFAALRTRPGAIRAITELAWNTAMRSGRFTKANLTAVRTAADVRKIASRTGVELYMERHLRRLISMTLFGDFPDTAQDAQEDEKLFIPEIPADGKDNVNYGELYYDPPA